MLRKEQHVKIHLKSDSDFIKPTDEAGRKFAVFIPWMPQAPTPMRLAQTRHCKKMCQIHYLVIKQ